MGIAIELYVDAETEAAIARIRAAVTRAGVRPLLDELGDRPHVSLAVMSGGDDDRLIDVARRLATELASFPIRLGAVGAFAGSGGVLYLAPAPTQALLDAHERAHALLRQIDHTPHAYYLPGQWTPHCTIAQEVPRERMGAAFEAARAELQPIAGNAAEVGIVRFRPIVPLAAFALARGG